VSFRSHINEKSHAQLVGERVMTEMQRAVYGDGEDHIRETVEGLQRDGVSLREIREAINLESARTEKFNRYDDGQDSPKSKIRISLGLGVTMDRRS
jgi:DNA-binding transcriptional MerR regulator